METILMRFAQLSQKMRRSIDDASYYLFIGGILPQKVTLTEEGAILFTYDMVEGVDFGERRMEVEFATDDQNESRPWLHVHSVGTSELLCSCQTKGVKDMMILVDLEFEKGGMHAE